MSMEPCAAWRLRRFEFFLLRKILSRRSSCTSVQSACPGCYLLSTRKSKSKSKGFLLRFEILAGRAAIYITPSDISQIYHYPPSVAFLVCFTAHYSSLSTKNADTTDHRACNRQQPTAIITPPYTQTTIKLNTILLVFMQSSERQTRIYLANDLHFNLKFSLSATTAGFF